jgi:hypothetical protein
MALRVASCRPSPPSPTGPARARELLAYFDEPTTNGYAEGVINKVKLISAAHTQSQRSKASDNASS